MQLEQSLLFGPREPAPRDALGRPKVIALRPYQSDAIVAVKDLRAPGERVLVVAPTGAGKTVIASQLIVDELDAGGTVLFIAHRTELIEQTYATLLARGIPERDLGIVMGDGVILHPVSNLRVCCRRPLARVQVASIDTLRGRAKPRATLVIVDECFPAGTLVDGRPIETIRVGDLVRSFNHATGRVELRPVTFVFRSPLMGELVTVHLTDGTRITCTSGHPFFTRDGYAPAAQLTPESEVLRADDQAEGLRRVRHGVHPALLEQHDDPGLLARLQGEASRGAAAGSGDLVPAVLRDGGPQGADAVPGATGAGLLLGGVPTRDVLGGLRTHDGGDQPEARERPDAGAQPDALARGAWEDVGHPAAHGLDAAGARRQRSADAGAATPPRRGAEVADGGRGPDGTAEGSGEPCPLHARHREPGGDGGGGGRRGEPLLDDGARPGRAEGCVPSWVRVDRVEVHERAGDDGPGGLCPDGHVYNLEVEDNHNYLVEGVLVHNCHRALAKSYRDAADAYPEALHVGLTATPYRADGRGLGDVYRRLVIVATPRALMDQGHLVEPRCFTHPVKPSLAGVKTTAGDYDQEQLGAAMDKRELVGNLVEHWGRLGEGHRTVVFATNVAHSRHIVEAFRGAGVAAEHLDGETDKDTRKAVLRRLDAGETRVVANAMLLVEGWDMPSVKGCILAAPTKSRAKYIQQKGRVVRPWEGVVPVVLDHAGNILEHGLLQDDFEITLEGRKKKDKQAVSVKECPGCFAALPQNTAVCPICSHPFGSADPDEGKLLEERDGHLVEVRAGEVRRKPTGEERDLRGYIHRLTQEWDQRHRWEPGECNRLLARRYGKGRADMGMEELRRVAAYLETRPWERQAALHFEVPSAPSEPLRFAVPAAEGAAA